jgi:leucyl aminopeptidase (aminopeptidase T)
MSASDCADGWVPRQGGRADLLVLCGVRPWRESVDGDHLVEIEAMTRREALLAAGQRMLFVDWPRGARRDAEIDLRPVEMAQLYRRALDMDYAEMRRWNHRLSEWLEGSESVEITCPEGTALTLSVAGRRWLPEDCVLGPAEPAVYLPGGEIYTAAVEESARGQVAFRHIGEPRLARFESGLLVAVERADGSADADLGEEMGVGTEPLCELGVGTNPWAPPWQVGTLYEKSAGTVHVAVGGNAHFGGLRDSPRHMDLIIRAPTVTVDGRSLDLPPARWDDAEPR